MRKIESFFWGIIAALGALIIELIVFIAASSFSIRTTNMSFSDLFIIPQFIIAAVCIEELFKYLIISKRIDLISLERSYLINSFFVGLGFLFIEIGLAASAKTLPAINILGEIAIIHIGTAMLIGYVVATRNPKKMQTFMHAIIITSLFHATYNILINNRTPIINSVILTLLFILVVLNIFNLIRINKKIAQS